MEASTIRCLVSAGPTREYLDPVRFLSNPSTGKMGFAVAEAARDRGWAVTLVTGPVALDGPEGVEVIRVETGAAMHAALLERFDSCHILFMTAAVMDARPLHMSIEKVKKDKLPPTLEMVPTTDILAELGVRKVGQVLVGFAAETSGLEANALDKLRRKNLDFIAANQVGVAGSGFASDTNTMRCFARTGESRLLGPDSKTRIASELVDWVAPALRRDRAGTP